MTEGKLLISENEIKILENLLSRIENTQYGLITNWGEPYGISFMALRNHIERIKYGDKYMDQKELEELKQRLDIK